MMEKKGVKINWVTKTKDKCLRIDEVIKLIDSN